MSDNLYKSGKSSDTSDGVSSAPNPSGAGNKKGAGITLGILAFVGIILAVVFLPEYCQDQLRQNGLPATAIITSVRDTGNRFNDQPEVEFQLDVTAPGFAPYKATAKMYISPVYLPQFQPGKKANIKYDPKDQYRVVIVSVEN